MDLDRHVNDTRGRTDRALIIFVRNPELGKVKTRLAAGIGDEAALKVYRKLLEKTRETALEVDAARYLFYADYVVRGDAFDNQAFRKYAQSSGDLGVRMEYAFSIPIKAGIKSAVIIGSDCWDLNSMHIEQAFEALESNDFVLGPANDGGYYLLGMKKWERFLFPGMEWSTSGVRAETLRRIEEKGKSVKLLEELTDIDNKEDLDKAGIDY